MKGLATKKDASSTVRPARNRLAARTARSQVVAFARSFKSEPASESPLSEPSIASAEARRCRVACRRRFAPCRWVVARALCRRQSMFSPRLAGRDKPPGLRDEPQPAKRGGFGRALRRRRPHAPPAPQTELIHTTRAIIESKSAAVFRTGCEAGRSVAVRVGSRSVV